MQIKFTSIFVKDQGKALQFYTEKLGFVKKTDMPAGDFKWITVVSPEDPDGVELLLEPNDNPAAKTYQEAIYDQGIPATAFVAADLDKTYTELRNLGVEFTLGPTEAGPTKFAILDDTCGNLIQLSEVK